MRISENVRTSFNQDGAVLMDIEGGVMLTLNPVGSIIWHLLSDGRTPEQIAQRLALEFGISCEQALTDVNEFLQQVKAQHLLDLSESEVPRTRLGKRLSDRCWNVFGRGSPSAVQDRRSK